MNKKFTKNDDMLLMRLINTDRLLYREVAGVMGTTIGRVSGRITRLRKAGYVINAVGLAEYNLRVKGKPAPPAPLPLPSPPRTRVISPLPPTIPLHLFAPKESKCDPTPPVPPSLLKKEDKYSYIKYASKAVLIGITVGVVMVVTSVPSIV